MGTRRFLTAVVCGASGALVALAGSGLASADPIPPTPPQPPPPVAAEAAPVAPAAGPVVTAAGPVVTAAAPVVEAAPVVTAAGPVSAPDAAPVPAPAGETPHPEGVPHLASPDALPPGSTMDPSTQGNEGPNVSYLKDLWHAVQGREISGKEALIMGLAQRGMNTPYPVQQAGPNVPLSPGGPVDPAVSPPPPGAPLPPPPAPDPAPAALAP